jgi:abequosyltransferase
MNIPKLSICIATLNRAAYIGETLDSIITQATGDVEIVVLDGASKDNTREVVEARQRGFPGLRYFRQEANGGVDRDFDNAVGNATGEYCWLMSDDDVLKQGAVQAVLDAIRSAPSLVVLNAEVRNSDLSNLIEERHLRLGIDTDYGSEEMERLFVDTALYLTFIGCVIINRELWLGRNRTGYYGSFFIHVGVIFQAALPGGAKVLANPLISVRYGNAMWKSREFEIWMRRWPGLIWSLPALPDSAKSRVHPLTAARQLRRLVAFRALGAYTLEEYRKWIAPRVEWARLRVPARLIAICPGFLINAVTLLYCRLFGRGMELAIVDLRSSRFYFPNWIRKPLPW